MDESITIGFTLSSSDISVPLGIKIYLDSAIVYENSHVASSEAIQFAVDDADGSHELVIEMFGKRPEHTSIDADGTIVKDALLSVTNFVLEDINITQLLTDISEYRHNFNGTRESVVEKFNGHMGCNGTVTLRFTTPIYIWLLENI